VNGYACEFLLGVVAVVSGRLDKVSRLSPARFFYNKIFKLEGPNDGLVSVKSAQWGTYLGAVELNHWELLNWNPWKDVRYVYSRIAALLAQKEQALLWRKPTKEAEK